ncbi:hypothetical protein ACJIZ3_020960 [Penstemon smallii]|uniref:Homeobox domain-containing protein n=1 Tax=Penstemon smallii TaxID=265156 RepID=A0ABD3SK35_9LAMI
MVYATEVLMSAFEESEHLTKQKKIELGNTTGLDVEQIASWFNRKRAHKRARESVIDLEQTNAELQQNLRESKKRETKLRLDIEQSKRRQTAIGAENQRLRQQLGMIGGADSEFDSMVSTRSVNKVGDCS